MSPATRALLAAVEAIEAAVLHASGWTLVSSEGDRWSDPSVPGPLPRWTAFCRASRDRVLDDALGPLLRAHHETARAALLEAGWTTAALDLRDVAADPLRWRDPEQSAARPLSTTHALLVLQRRAEA